jgi:hypothetical protein
MARMSVFSRIRRRAQPLRAVHTRSDGFVIFVIFVIFEIPA